MDLIKESSTIVTTNATNAFDSVMSLSSEWIAGASLAILLFAYFLYVGKSKTLSFVISLYLSSFAFSIFPYKDKILELGSTPNQGFWFLVVFFIILFFLANWVMRSMIWEDYPSRTVKKLFEAGLLALVTAGAVITVLVTILSLESIYPLSESTSKIFSSNVSLFWSNIISLAVLFFVSRN